MVKKEDVKIELTKAEKIRQEFLKYGFGELPLVKKLRQSQLDELFVLIGQNDLPYQIAMIKFLGFIDYLLMIYWIFQRQ